MEIVLNEIEWVEDMVRELRLGDQPWLTLKRYAMYLYSHGYNKPAIRRALEDYVIRCDHGANRVQWEPVIDRAVKDCASRELYKVDGISITKSDIDAVEKLNGRIKQKVMFTLICLAKYGNAIRKSNNGWVNYSITDIFSLANVNLSRKRQMLILHSLCELEMISHSKIVDSTSIRVMLDSTDSEEALYISDFRNLGNQYMRFFSEDYIECAKCGLVIRKKNNAHKYCKHCAEEVNRIGARYNYHSRIA